MRPYRRRHQGADQLGQHRLDPAFRYPYYHTADDLPDKPDFDRMALVTARLEKVVAEIAVVKSVFGAGQRESAEIPPSNHDLVARRRVGVVI